MILSSTTFSLKKALCLLLFSSLLISSYSHLEDGECHHDKIEQNPEILDIEEDKSILEEGADRILASTSNFRIYPYFDYLKASSSYVSYIETELVAPIIDYFQGALKVKYPLAGKLQLGSSVSKICDHSVPSILRSGVDADFFMYYDIDTATSFIAAAQFCYLAAGSKRPIVGKTSINSNKLVDPKGNDIVHEKNLVTMMHEMIHALGFSSYSFPYFLDESGNTRKGHIKTFNIAGNTRTVIDIPVLTQKLRNYYGCSSLQGAIMENNGGSGTAVSHFERKYFGYEAMTSGSIIGKRFSEFSLGMLEASGWYAVDYSYAEPFSWGQGNGCDFLSTSCSNAASKFDEFCTGSNRGCAATGRGGGSCNNDPNMDGCRFQFPLDYNDCENDDAQDYARLPDLQVFGRGTGSRCFSGTLNTRSSNSLTTFCFKYNCVGSGSNTQVEVQVGNKKVTCTQEGSQTIDGYYGTVNCPDPLTFCNGPGKKFCPRNCMGRGTCMNGKCQCNSGYSGSDCAMRI